MTEETPPQTHELLSGEAHGRVSTPHSPSPRQDLLSWDVPVSLLE